MILILLIVDFVCIQRHSKAQLSSSNRRQRWGPVSASCTRRSNAPRSGTHTHARSDAGTLKSTALPSRPKRTSCSCVGRGTTVPERLRLGNILSPLFAGRRGRGGRQEAADQPGQCIERWRSLGTYVHFRSRRGFRGF